MHVLPDGFPTPKTVRDVGRRVIPRSAVLARRATVVPIQVDLNPTGSVNPCHIRHKNFGKIRWWFRRRRAVGFDCAEFAIESNCPSASKSSSNFSEIFMTYVGVHIFGGFKQLMNVPDEVHGSILKKFGNQFSRLLACQIFPWKNGVRDYFIEWMKLIYPDASKSSCKSNLKNQMKTLNIKI